MFEKKKEQKPESPEPKKPSFEEVVEDNKQLIETLQRLQAEFENFKKREEKNREEFSKFCMASVFSEFLEFMDSFESAMQKCTQGQKESLEPLYYQLKKFLEKNSIKQFSAVDERFDPELHEVLLTGFKPDKDENIVLEEIKKGYYYHGKVLRHAFVKVNQKPVKQMEEIKNSLKEQLSKLAGGKPEASEKAIQDSKDKVSERLFSKNPGSRELNESIEEKESAENGKNNRN